MDGAAVYAHLHMRAGNVVQEVVLALQMLSGHEYWTGQERPGAMHCDLCRPHCMLQCSLLTFQLVSPCCLCGLPHLAQYSRLHSTSSPARSFMPEHTLATVTRS
jgi:hypothetical protein